jgi:serine/threonine protein kinase
MRCFCVFSFLLSPFSSLLPSLSGCVFAELLLGAPLFPGESGVGQLIEIIKVLGSPTKEEVLSMNPNHSASFKFPAIKPQPWTKVFKGKAGEKALDLISKWLRYKPLERTPPLESLAHPFFDELREPGLKLPNGRPLPPLFNFTEKELKLIEAKGLTKKLIPAWYVPTPVVSQHISMAAQNAANQQATSPSAGSGTK